MTNFSPTPEEVKEYKERKELSRYDRLTDIQKKIFDSKK